MLVTVFHLSKTTLPDKLNVSVLISNLFSISFGFTIVKLTLSAFCDSLMNPSDATKLESRAISIIDVKLNTDTKETLIEAASCSSIEMLIFTSSPICSDNPF